MIRAGVFAMALLATVPPGAVAQAAPRYTRSPGDTLRYNERTNAHVVTQAPQGSFDVRTEHEATLALTFGPGDQATAWYEALRLAQRGPGPQNTEPATGALLGKPYALTMSPQGRLSVSSTPEFPAEIAKVTDLSHQFDDFLISLPASALRMGTQWSDTVVSTRSGRAVDTFSGRIIRNYRVERDTTIDGISAVVIGVTQAVRFEATSPFEGQPLRASTRLEGEERGIAIFAPATGRLLARRRAAQLTGALQITGGAQLVTLHQRYEYQGSLDLVR